MQRTISLLMLSVILVVGIVPTIGIHYCGEEFRKLEFALNKTNNNITSCCENKKSTETDTFAKIENKSCCNTTEIELELDKYQVQERTDRAPLFSESDSQWILLFDIKKQIITDLSNILEHYFPPTGYSVKDLDILTFICILRI